MMYRISQNKRRFSPTPIVRVETDDKGKEKEVQVLFCALPKKEGDAFLQKVLTILNQNQ